MRPQPSIPLRILNFFSSVGLATALLLILMVETWLATLEQVRHGLFDTLEKYFNMKAWYVLPDAAIMGDTFSGKFLPPLPGGYWVCLLLALNILLGGIIRMRKGWKNTGILLAHIGIVVLMAGGAVSQLFEERGVMSLLKGQTADYAQSLTETTVEVIEAHDGKPTGAVHFVTDQYYRDCVDGRTRVVKVPGLPFDLEFAGYVRNADPSPVSKERLKGEPVVDGWFLADIKVEKEEESNHPGIHVKLKPGNGSGDSTIALLTTAAFQPLTYHLGDRTFLIRMTKRVWPTPFKVRLDSAKSKFFPNTNRPRSFDSNITRIDHDAETQHFIEMNAPMRYAGMTFYQRQMAARNEGGDGDAAFSQFEVVRNPSDKWPKYSILITGAGLLGHFIFKLATFILGRRSKRALP